MTDDADQIPAATIEWTAQPGDARRATFSLLREGAFWRRVAMHAVLVCVALTVIYLVMGVTFQHPTMPVPVFVATCVLLTFTSRLLTSYLQNYRVLRTGTRWEAGSDAALIRIGNPWNTIILNRANIESIKRHGALVVLIVWPRVRVGVPAALHGALIGEPHDLSH